MVAEAAPSSGVSQSPLSLSPTSSLIKYAVFNYPLKARNYSPSLVFTCQALSILNNYINAVNQVISSAPPSSPLLLVGDLNCHIGKLGGPRSSSDANQRGVEWIEYNSLYIPSLSTLATGPVHTFHSNRTATTAIGNLSLSIVLVSCCVEEDHPLIVSKLNLSLLTSTSASIDHAPRPDWNSARRQGCLSHYASLADSAVASLANKDYSSIEASLEPASRRCSILHSTLNTS